MAKRRRIECYMTVSHAGFLSSKACAVGYWEPFKTGNDELKAVNVIGKESKLIYIRINEKNR